MFSFAGLHATIVGWKNCYTCNLSEIGIAWNGIPVSVLVHFWGDLSINALVFVCQFEFLIRHSVNDTGLNEVRIFKLDTSCAAFCLIIDICSHQIAVVYNSFEKYVCSAEIVCGWVEVKFAHCTIII